MDKRAKLSRDQIREGLNTIPLESIILGSQSKEKTLTPKQREFARQVALGETKASAYRKAYNSQGKAKTQGDAGSRLAQHSGISAEIIAYQAAIEASKHRTPAALRELVIHQLTQHALDQDVNPAQRLKALELLGKVSEVAAFTERKEVTTITQSGDIKARLMSMLQAKAIQPITDLEPIDQANDTDSLLAEIRGDGMRDTHAPAPTTPPPAPDARAPACATTHTISHTESPPESIPPILQTVFRDLKEPDASHSHLQVVDSKEKDNLSETSFRCEGVGGVEYSEIEYEIVPAEVPPNDSVEKG